MALMILSFAVIFQLIHSTVAVNGPPKKPTTDIEPYFFCNETSKKGVIECILNGESKFYDNGDDMVVSLSDPTWWLDFAVATFLVCTSGVMSGLTIGLMGLDLTNLEVVKKTGTQQERQYAKRIIPLLKRHHLLLCTLLVCNAAALEALPIFLEHLVPSVAAVIISVTLILIFGEVIPQALCTRWGLAIGAKMSPFVWILIILTFPLSWPISKILDLAIGTGHGTFFNRAELKELVAIHGEKLKKANTQEIPQDALTYDEITIIRGALDLSKKTLKKCFTPLEKTFMLEINTPLNTDTLKLVFEKGHSRIPIYKGSPNHVVGMILIKDLLLYRNQPQVSISSLEIRRTPMAYSSMPLYKLLDIFRDGGSHMAIVIDDKDHTTPIGIVTLEDVIEELIQEDIEDEADLRRRKSRRRSKAQSPRDENRLELIEKDVEDDVDKNDYTQTDINSVYWAQDDDEPTVSGQFSAASPFSSLMTNVEGMVRQLKSSFSKVV